MPERVRGASAPLFLLRDPVHLALRWKIALVPYSIQFDTPYGSFIVHRHDVFHPPHIVQTGRPFMSEEIDHLLAISDLLGPNPIVVDAGANVGFISVPIGRRIQGMGGTLVAFEPQRLVYNMLCGNVALAGLQNVMCHHMALGEREDTLLVPYLDPCAPANFGNVTLLDQNQGGEPVAVVPLDAMGLPRLDLLKIDVEAMELAVLRGAAGLIARHRPIIWMEVWQEQYSAAFAWAQANHYAMLVVDQLNFCLLPNERRAGLPIAFPEFDGVHHPVWNPLETV